MVTGGIFPGELPKSLLTTCSRPGQLAVTAATPYQSCRMLTALWGETEFILYALGAAENLSSPFLMSLMLPSCKSFRATQHACMVVDLA